MTFNKYDHSLSSDCLNYCRCCGLKIHRSKQKMEFDLGKSSQFVVVQLGWWKKGELIQSLTVFSYLEVCDAVLRD